MNKSNLTKINQSSAQVFESFPTLRTGKRNSQSN